MKEYIFNGKIIAKKNNKQIFRTKDGRPFITSSKLFKSWDEEAGIQLLQQGKCFFKGSVSIKVEFTVGDHRKFDMSNSFESIADLLVNYGIIVDDNYSVLQDIHMKYAGYEKGVWKTKVVLRDIKEVV